MSVQKHTLSYPTSMNQSVMGSSPSQVDVSTLGDIALWEEFSSNAVYPEENASNHICHPVHGTASYARHSAIPDFDFAFEDTFPQVVDWNINGKSMGESSSVMDSSVLGGSYPNPSPATSLPFELIASTSRPLIALTDLSHSPTSEVSSPTSYLGWSSHISPGVGGKDHPTRSIDGSQSMTTGNTDLGPCASHCDSSLLGTHRERECEPSTGVDDVSSFSYGVNGNSHNQAPGGGYSHHGGHTKRHLGSSTFHRSSKIQFDPMEKYGYRQGSARAIISATRTSWPGPEPSGHASRPIGPDRIHPGNFNSPLMGCNSWYGNDPAVPHPRGSHPASAEHIQPGGNYPSMSQLAYQEFVLPMTSNCSDGGSSGSWTQSLSPDSQPVIHAGSRNMFSIPHETQNDASSGSWKVSANDLVDGVFNTSAGQHNNFQDLGPSLEEEMRLTGDSERINICEPGGRASAEHLLILQCPSSLYEQPQPQQKPQPSQPTQPSFPVPSSSPSPISSESLLSSSPTRRRGAAPGPLLPCPWGMLYGMNGEEYRCSFSESTVNNGRVLEHWARHHVANEVFAIRRKIIKMTHANIVKTQWRLETALLHLGLCPNPECDTESPMRVWYNRSKERKRHITKHPSCEKFFGHSFGKKEKGKVGGRKQYGNVKLGMLLGYVSPTS
ncbi:hypothetical protein BU17DRAFT_88589 [Hysterangium stoloniferum]|nr:hypothetical protein BU17DRAFT_88589 [Hysterangium stoloniferum]